MTLEIACIDILEGRGAAFEAAAAEAVPLFAAAEGCNGMRILRSHEVGGRYWLLVDWRDVAAHEAFRLTPAFARWRDLVGGHFTGPPTVEHGLPIGIGF